MARSIPAWKRLVEEGWFSTREEASRWILAGKVRAGSAPVRTAGQLVKAGEALHVRGAELTYVSKGGLKLAGALRAFGLDIGGRVCIDAGASTGGFTDCLLRHGAAHVYAVDVGYGQLAGSLRLHPAVTNLERTNIGDAALLALDPVPTLGSVDLSYLSLRKAVPQFAAILRGRGDLLCLVKPLFEVDDPDARRTGEIATGAYAPLLTSLAEDFALDGLAVMGITHSPVTGKNGTLEFFLHLSLDSPGGLSAGDRARQAQAAVDAAQALPAYHKS